MRLHHAAPLLALLLLAGCLPSSCRREASRVLLPADSLSRQRAEQVPVDTLQAVWQTMGTSEHPLAYPRTVRFGGDGQVYVSDAQRNSFFVFAGDGTLRHEVSAGQMEVPYLAGLRGDTVIVFSPGTERFDFYVDGTAVHSVPTPPGLPEDALQYAAATDRTLYLKVLAQDADNYIARLDDMGGVAERYVLAGPYWRYAGLLRPWGDTLLSLAGYRPLVDVLPPGHRTVDSLALHGFDSPMLARSRSFLVGEVHEPPLLSASAAPVGNRLFVLNLRPGWLRIDVFNRAGQLQHRLVQPDPQEQATTGQYYPVDLAVRQTQEGTYEIAVAATKPEPHVRLYRWSPATNEMSRGDGSSRGVGRR